MQASTISDLTASLPGFDPAALSVDNVRAILAATAKPVGAVEMRPIRDALDRVVARDILSTIDVPPHDNSAMDGYALRGEDLSGDANTRLNVVGTALAGKSWSGELQPGQCVRIMTGAVMPRGADTVVPQELAQVASDVVEIAAGVLKPGDNRRLAGEDLQRGEVAIPAGRIVKPADLGLLASLGIAEVPLRRKLRVAFFSTGDELRSIGEVLDAGCIYDSNRYTLHGMLTRLRCIDLIDMGVVPDNREALEAAMREAADNADVIITSGGVSVGEADHTKAVMQALGDVQFWKIAMRPGRPMAVGHIRQGDQVALLLGLPGNPVAVMVTFYAFARDALLAMAGASVKPLPTISARLSAPVRKKPGRTEYQRVRLQRGDDGHWQALLTGQQGSGVLRSMADADGLLVLAHDQASLQQGDWVEVLPFDALI